MMAEDAPIRDPYQFYNNRYLRRKEEEESPKVHSYSPTTTGSDRKSKRKRKIKLLPFVNESGSDGRFVVTDSDKVNVKRDDVANVESGMNGGYLPAELNVQDLLPEEENGGKQIPSMDDVVIVTAHDSSVLGEMKVDLAAQTNPYNKINQKFHSALWFPGCIFLFYIFCVPAMMYMRRSDEMYAEHDFKAAKRNGSISTVFYIGGVLFGLCFYAFVVLLAIYLTHSY